MDHLLIHRLEVLRRAPTGSEDGTPIMGELELVPWANGRTYGACRLDTPRDTMMTNSDGSMVIVARSTILTGMGCPATELDTLRVITNRGPETWTGGGISDAGGMHGSHHIEIPVSREVHR